VFNYSKIRLVALVAAFTMALAVPATAMAIRGADVMKGDFTTLSGGDDLGYAIRGTAGIGRYADSTLVVVNVRGLDANQTYPTHVHNAACSSTPAGGSHYQNIVGGPVDNINEIWPTVTTNTRGHGVGIAWHSDRARSDAMSIVIHYPADTSIRLACVDLN
jgi:hypothetical protein